MSESKADLIYSFRELTITLIKNWKKLASDMKINGSPQDIIVFRDGELIPIIEKITVVAANSVRLKKNKEFVELFELLAKIYQSAAEVEEFVVGGNEHLSWTIPSKLSMEYIYILGALSISEDNIETIKTILEFRIKRSRKYELKAGEMILLLSHPYYASRSKEGTFITFFDDARATMKNNPVIYEWFDNSDDEALDNLLMFDFLRGLSLITAKENYWWYDNFRRFYNYRINFIINALLSDKDYEKIFGNEIKRKLIDFLSYVDNQPGDGFSHSWIKGEWKSLSGLKD